MGQERFLEDKAQEWRAICSSSCEARTSTGHRDAGSLIGLFVDLDIAEGQAAARPGRRDSRQRDTELLRPRPHRRSCPDCIGLIAVASLHGRRRR
jgi:hypothetical protein